MRPDNVKRSDVLAFTTNRSDKFLVSFVQISVQLAANGTKSKNWGWGTVGSG